MKLKLMLCTALLGTAHTASAVLVTMASEEQIAENLRAADLIPMLVDFSEKTGIPAQLSNQEMEVMAVNSIVRKAILKHYPNLHSDGIRANWGVEHQVLKALFKDSSNQKEALSTFEYIRSARTVSFRYYAARIRIV